MTHIRFSRIDGTIKPYALLILALAQALLVCAGSFEDAAALPWYLVTLASVVAALGIFEFVRRPLGFETKSFPHTAAAVALWTVTVWAVYRMCLFYAPQAIFIPAALTAWSLVSYPIRIFLFFSLFVITMESGLLLIGIQTMTAFSLNLFLYGISALFLSFFIRSRTYRKSIKKAIKKSKKDENSREYARDLGLFSEPASILKTPSVTDTLAEGDVTHSTVESISLSFNLQLEMIRQAYDLSTVALFWLDASKDELRIRSLATVRKDIQPGPFPIGSGITGALLKDCREVAVAPVTSSHNSLPYYPDQKDVGSIFAIRVETEKKDEAHSQQTKISGILCLDRRDTTPWTDEERNVFRLTARKLALDVAMARQLQAIDKEKNAMLKVCVGLRELNSALGLDSVFDSTINAIKSVLPVDFIAVSQLQEKSHCVVRAEGVIAEKYHGKKFSLEDGLVGQVLKIKHPLPAGAEYHGPAPIFSIKEKTDRFKTLLILPLKKEDESVIGALTVAAEKPGIMTQSRKEILELIANQVTVKIDLAQAHEKISKMATTDGLTGLINHRTFQYGFDIMLKRTTRRADSPLCLIFCDIDHFKKINDTYGHPFGDQVLKSVTEILSKTGRANLDLVARYGGEEFAFVLEDADEKGGCGLAERIRSDIEAMTVHFEKKVVQVTMSLGVAAYPKDGKDKRTLIARADQALYKAKKDGRNRTVPWSEISGQTSEE